MELKVQSFVLIVLLLCGSLETANTEM